jgi:membrane protein
MKTSQWIGLVKDTVNAWLDDFAPSMGAAISYYTLFSLAPLLVLVIAIAGLVVGTEAVQGQIANQLTSLMGRDTAETIQSMVESAWVSGNGIWAGALSIAVLLVGATTVFAELQSALDRIWHVPQSKKPSGLWGILRARLFSFGLILCLAFLLMVSLAVSAGLAAFGTYLGGLLPGQEALLRALNLAVSLAVTTALFAVVFKWMPTAKVAWGDVWIGAIVTAILFEVGKLLIGLYLGKSGLANTFAGAGSLVILLAWVYYAAQIFLFGAEFTKVYAFGHGSAQGRAAEETHEPVDGIPTKSTTGLAQPVVPQLAVASVQLDRRVERAVSSALPKVLLLGAVALLRIASEQRLKSERKRLRTARRHTA